MKRNRIQRGFTLIELIATGAASTGTTVPPQYLPTSCHS